MYVPKEPFLNDWRFVPRAGCAISTVEPLCQMMGLLLSPGRHDTGAPRVLDIKAAIGVTVSEVQAKIQKRSLAVDWPPVLRFGRVCNELRYSSSWLWHGKLHHHGGWYQTRARTIQIRVHSHRRLRAGGRGGSC